MLYPNILDALSASGNCESCRGEGSVFVESDPPHRDSSGNETCSACGGTGRDPNALLRAVQAIGWILLKTIGRKIVRTPRVRR